MSTSVPKASKRIWQEIVLLRRYAGEVAEHWKGILGSVTVIGALWIAGHFGASLLARVVSLLPDAISPWLTRNRIIVYSVSFVLALAQYLAWRKLRLTVDSEQPDIDARLKQTEELPVVTEGQPLAHSLVMTFEALAEIESVSLAVESRGRIYKAYADYRGRHSEARVPSREGKHIRANLILFEFPVPKIATGDQLSPITLKSPRAII